MARSTCIYLDSHEQSMMMGESPSYLPSGLPKHHNLPAYGWDLPSENAPRFHALHADIFVSAIEVNCREAADAATSESKFKWPWAVCGSLVSDSIAIHMLHVVLHV